MPFSVLCRGGSWRKECPHWSMRVDESNKGEAERWYLPHALDGEWQTVQVPHCWEQEGISKRVEGPVWYATEVEVPKDWQRGRIWLLFEGVSYATQVWVNGKRMGEHLGIWDRFACEITPLLQDGKAFVALRVLKPGAKTYPVPTTLAGFLPYVSSTFGGIWQPVWLIRTPEAWIEDFYPRVCGKGHVEVEVSCAGQLPAMLTLTLYRPDGQEVDSQQVQCDERGYVRVTLDDPNPIWWSPNSPKLYRLQVQINDLHGDSCIITREFGMRTVQAKGDTVLLNGSPIYPRGILHWGWYPQHIHPNPTEGEIRAELEGLRALGYNMVKFCLWVPPSSYLRLCDEIGMLTWLELPMWLPETSLAFHRQVVEEYTRIVLQTRGHPSIIAWTLGCELSGQVGAAFLEKLYWLVKRLTDSPLVRDNSGGGECYEGLLKEHADFYDNHFYCDLHYLRPLYDYFAPRGRQLQPWLFGEYCDADTFRDLPAIVEANGALPWWAVEDEDVNPRGVRPELPVLQQLQRMQEHALMPYRESLKFSSRQQALFHRKVTIETTRLHREISGYVVTSITDTPIATSGMWDDLGELKWSTEEFRQFNADSVLLLQFHRRREWVNGGDRPSYVDRYNFISGETLYAHIALSHYGRYDCKGKLRWSLCDELGSVLQQGESTPSEPLRVGTLSPVGVLELKLPVVRQMSRLTLRCEMQLGNESVDNEWELWCYPAVDYRALSAWAVYDPVNKLRGAEQLGWERKTVSAEQLPQEVQTIATAWHPVLLTALRRGARVVLFQDQQDGLPAAGMPFWREAMKLMFPHPLWMRFRQQGFTGAQFYGLACDCALIPEALPEVLGADAHIQPVMRRVDARSSMIHDYLLEVLLGEGRMLATTLRITGGMGDQPSGILRNVAGAWLLYAMTETLSDKTNL